MPPEQHARKAYDGRQADIFSSAVILFMMATQRMPFVEARVNDPFYQLIAGNRAQFFWKKFEKVGDDLKDLLTGMLQLNTSARYTLEEIMIHPWFDGPTATNNEIVDEFNKRKSSIDTFKKGNKGD